MSECSQHEQIVLCKTNTRSRGGQKDRHSFIKVNLFLSSFLKPPLEIKENAQTCHIKKCNHFKRQLPAQHLLSQDIFILKNIIQQMSSTGVVKCQFKSLLFPVWENTRRTEVFDHQAKERKGNLVLELHISLIKVYNCTLTVKKISCLQRILRKKKKIILFPLHEGVTSSHNYRKAVY